MTNTSPSTSQHHFEVLSTCGVRQSGERVVYLTLTSVLRMYKSVWYLFLWRYWEYGTMIWEFKSPQHSRALVIRTPINRTPISRNNHIAPTIISTPNLAFINPKPL